MLSLLAGLEGNSEITVSVYMAPGISPAEAGKLLGEAFPGDDIPEGIPEIAAGSATGAVVFRGRSRTVLVQPPFPLAERFITPGCDTEPLRSLLEHRFTVALLLVRLGAFAIGIWQGEELVISKTGTGLVHGRHRKGGQSQRRFERRRLKQADEFLERVYGHAREQLEPHADVIDYLVYGGSRAAIRELQLGCPFLRRFEGRTLPPLLDIPPPRRAVLEAAIEDVLSSGVTEWWGNSNCVL